jgi:SagB-type dehydrogenase family enzyme
MVRHADTEAALPVSTPLALRWRLVPDASIVPSREDELTLELPGGIAVTLTPGHADLRDALLALANGADEAGLAALAGEERAAELYYYVARLVELGVLEATADRDRMPVVRLLPRSRSFDLPVPQTAPRKVALDRFAFLRRGERGAMLQHPDATCDLLVEHDAAGDLILRLAAGSLDTIAVDDDLDLPLVALLVALGFAGDASAAEEPSRRTWEFHDRLFQRAARAYDDLAPPGGTYRFIGALPAPPAIRPRHVGTSVDLPAPSAERASGKLIEVMEKRRSWRDMADTPVSLEAVGELLRRVARVTKVIPGTPELPQDVMLRPYPSGGAIHELEFYLAVRACEGLAPGFYHYRSHEHALTRIDGAETPATEMLEDCASAWGQPGRPPQVLVVLASRLPRLAWKYTGIAYKISLMNAGVAIQSLHLVATDLGLAGSAAGAGNPELFARATGVSSWEETSIAEFGFGRPA